MNVTAPRTLLRWTHLVFSIPVLGYIYTPFDQLPQYASAVRFIFVPVLVLSGFWMYAGVTFAVLGVAVWLGAYLLAGPGTAVLSQIALFLARLLWLKLRRPRTA